MNEFVKYKWENDEQYVYRWELFNISQKVQEILRSSEIISKMKIPDYFPLLKKLTVVVESFKKLNVPEEYKISNNFLLQGYEYYIKGYQMLVDGFKNKNTNITLIALKASKLIECGTAFATIVSMKNIEFFESKVGDKNVN